MNVIQRIPVILIAIFISCNAALAVDAPQVISLKKTYEHGESIKVNYSNAPGLASDWISISPANSPDKEAGDYQYTANGLSSSTLIFPPPIVPGDYEVRAYYNYSRRGYNVTARQAFTVNSRPEYENLKALEVKPMELIDRAIDTSNPLESNLQIGEGLVYLYRESVSGFMNQSANIIPEIKANEKPITYIRDARYSIFKTSGGNIVFSVGNLFTEDSFSGAIEKMAIGLVESIGQRASGVKYDEVKFSVNPGRVSYISVNVNRFRPNSVQLERINASEGANYILNNKLTLTSKDEIEKFNPAPQTFR